MWRGPESKRKFMFALKHFTAEPRIQEGHEEKLKIADQRPGHFSRAACFERQVTLLTAACFYYYKRWIYCIVPVMCTSYHIIAYQTQINSEAPVAVWFCRVTGAYVWKHCDSRKGWNARCSTVFCSSMCPGTQSPITDQHVWSWTSMTQHWVFLCVCSRHRVYSDDTVVGVQGNGAGD